MGLHYDINQKQLKAENKFRIDHFTLGPRNDSTNATHLPVKLAVALLKDRNGQINLDIPVTGRTDDPKFKLAPIIFKVVVNLLVKAATSPFSLLGALVGGGEELSFVEFAARAGDIPEAEAQKLEKLVKALDRRPALNLEIAGSFDPEKDRDALARRKLEQQLKILRLQELPAPGNPCRASKPSSSIPRNASACSSRSSRIWAPTRRSSCQPPPRPSPPICRPEPLAPLRRLKLPDEPPSLAFQPRTAKAQRR